MKDEIKELRKPLSERLSEEAFSVIHQAVGEASMCWTRVEDAGTFRADEASEVASDLCHYVADLIDEAKEELGDDTVAYVPEPGKSISRAMMLLQITQRIKAMNKNGTTNRRR